MVEPTVAPHPASIDLKPSVQCRICYENANDEALVTPCLCKGTVGFVHRSCLERWLGESNTNCCELCHLQFRIERHPRFTPRRSIWQWLHTRGTPRGITGGVRGDIAACAVITPVAIVITYACLFSSEYYRQNGSIVGSASTWTSISLLVMIGMMLIGYYLWVYSVIRIHSRMWYRWWQSDLVVRYVPPSNPQVRCELPVEVAAAPTLENSDEDVQSRGEAQEGSSQGGGSNNDSSDVIIMMPERRGSSDSDSKES